MYKVFFNDSTIQLSTESKKSLKNNITQAVDCEDSGFVGELISEIESGKKVINFVILNKEIDKLWNCFRSQFIEMPAAGGLVQSCDGSLLFIRRLGVWDLPKGKMEKGETPENAAIREVEEECGLTGLKIKRQLDSTFHIYRSPYIKFPNNLVLKETKWFLMSCSEGQTLVPQVEEDIEDVKWFTLSEIEGAMSNTYSSLRDFLAKTIPVI